MDKALCFELIFRGLRDKYGEAQVIPMFNELNLGRAFDGGEGSGNFNHAGRPGQVGGSSGKNGNEREKMLEDRFKRLLKAASQLQEYEDIEVKNLRDDLEPYDGSNDITIKYGQNNEKNKGYGLKHIAEKHGVESIKPVLKAIVYGKITRFVPTIKTIFIDYEGYEAMLALTEHGKRKTWLLTGYDIDESLNKKKTQDEDSKSS